MEIRRNGTYSDGHAVEELILTNKNKMRVTLLEIGAAVKAIEIPDENGKYTDVVLGFDDIASYEDNYLSLGANVGRVANRIENARFTLNGREYALTPWKKPGKPALHSFPDCYSERRFSYVFRSFPEGEGIEFSLFSPHMDQGYPGALTLVIRYLLTDENELRITYEAESTEDTLFNMTNHSYFNLNGAGSGDTLRHLLSIDSHRIAFYGRNLCPRGGLREISGTAYDFRREKEVGADLDSSDPEIRSHFGYDVAYEVNGGRKRSEGNRVARLVGDRSKITLEVLTDMPCLQLYTANRFPKNFIGKGGVAYCDHGAVCLEPGFFANAINVPGYEKPILRKNERTSYRIVYRFSKGE